MKQKAPLFKCNNTNKKQIIKAKVVKHSFTGGKITMYSGLNVVADFLNRQGIIKALSELFPTKLYNATKFLNAQVLMSIILSSLAGINRISRISNFTRDPLVQILLELPKEINENAISLALKRLGQLGARKLQNYLLSYYSKQLELSGLEHITLDADSTVSIVYGNQEGAEKGYNPYKKGAKSYHPLLVFVSELKLLYNTWFRSGSAHTANGISEALKEIKDSLPAGIKSIFFRADSGFFSGELLDLLDFFGWDYLIKVRLKNLQQLLANQDWQAVPGVPNVWVCEFSYTTKSWNGKKRKLKGVKILKEIKEEDFFGIKLLVPVYEYACYVSSLADKNGLELHEKYKERSTSETWIEEVKRQLLAGKTLTQDFWANDILWQLSCFAYNISVLMRRKHKNLRKQEHKTFREWFILVPGKIVRSSRVIYLKMYKHYYYQGNWLELAKLLKAS